jgi:hypothetical protein
LQIPSSSYALSDGRLTVARPPGEDFFLVWLQFEAPASDPLWCPCQCFEGSWDDVREGLDSFLENSRTSPTLKNRLSIHQGTDAIAVIRTLAHFTTLRSEMLRAQPLN